MTREENAAPEGKILVTGGSGQLAVSLSILGGDEIVRIGRPEFDFDRPGSIAAAIARYKPRAVVNAAAWTAVDLAESEPEAARRANETGPALLAAACAEIGVPLIHVSTDYVFSGDKGAPYVESDPIAPQTVYGTTKASGEIAALAANPQTIVLRTAWVYSAHGKNFVRTMIAAGARNPHLRVVGDQIGNPTSSDDLATAILAILARISKTGWQPEYAGIYHATAQGETSWHGLAVAALEIATRFERPMPEIDAIRTEDWPTPAKRPRDSRLGCDKLATVFGVRLPDWQATLTPTVETILSTP
ncbi:dTDP-4-dehydrorhamnose reductase [Gluconacetobacter sacchari]|uniref:dTDP-4-dehydrorhamnose reductase n=1 Tax=Gluconacetobacter sacchari TaxID=92759 RepID=UPI0039B4B4EA